MGWNIDKSAGCKYTGLIQESMSIILPCTHLVSNNKESDQDYYNAPSLSFQNGDRSRIVYFCRQSSCVW